jgi:hypothetical protein
MTTADLLDEYTRPRFADPERNPFDNDEEEFGNSTALTAPPKADAFASYIQIAGRAKPTRGDELKLQQAAVRIGELVGEDGYYDFPAGNKGRISGPSIRLAKALVQKWGSCGFGVEIQRVDQAEQRVYLTGVCVDFLTITVVRRDYTFALAEAKGGFAKNDEQRARWETMQIQSAGSKALRGAILDCLPSWFVRPAYEAARAMAQQNIIPEGKTLEQARADFLGYFEKSWQVSRQDLEELFEVPVVEWALAQIRDCRELARALKGHDTTVDEVFGELRRARARGPVNTGGGAHDALGLGKGAKSTATDSEPKGSKPRKPKGEGKGAEAKGDAKGEPTPKSDAPKSEDPPAQLEGVALVEAIKAAEAELDGGVEPVRRTSNLSMALSPLAVVERVGVDEARLYLVRLQNAIDDVRAAAAAKGGGE